MPKDKRYLSINIAMEKSDITETSNHDDFSCHHKFGVEPEMMENRNVVK